MEAWTEDLYFSSRKAQEAGAGIWCDAYASIICEHHDVYAGKKWELPRRLPPNEAKRCY